MVVENSLVFRKIATTVCFALVLAACSYSGSSEAAPAAAKSAKQAPKAESRKIAPEFALKDAQGKTVSLADYKGKVVLLNFWATWCGPCKIEIPWFIEFEQKYKDRGFAVIGVSMDEDGWDAVKPYLEKNRINYRVLLGDDKIAEAYGGVENLPTTFTIDDQGRIAGTHIGLVSKSDYENEIRQLLDTKRASSDAVHVASARTN